MDKLYMHPQDLMVYAAEDVDAEIAELKKDAANKILDNLEGFTFAGCSTSKLLKAIKFYDENHRTKLRLEKNDGV